MRCLHYVCYINYELRRFVTWSSKLNKRFVLLFVKYTVYRSTLCYVTILVILKASHVDLRRISGRLVSRADLERAEGTAVGFDLGTNLLYGRLT